MKKIFLALTLIITILFLILSGCSSNMWTNETTTVTVTTTTTEQTTLSEEEILNNRIKEINDGVIEDLKEEYGYLSFLNCSYIVFQDFINGLESSPSDFFFLGTTAEGVSKMYNTTRYFTKQDALNEIKQRDWGSADYVLCYNCTKKDDFGTEQTTILYVPVVDKNSEGFTYWMFSLDDPQDISLSHLILCVTLDRCTYNFI